MGKTYRHLEAHWSYLPVGCRIDKLVGDKWVPYRDDKGQDIYNPTN